MCVFNFFPQNITKFPLSTLKVRTNMYSKRTKHSLHKEEMRRTSLPIDPSNTRIVSYHFNSHLQCRFTLQFKQSPQTFSVPYSQIQSLPQATAFLKEHGLYSQKEHLKLDLPLLEIRAIKSHKINDENGQLRFVCVFKGLGDKRRCEISEEYLEGCLLYDNYCNEHRLVSLHFIPLCVSSLLFLFVLCVLCGWDRARDVAKFIIYAMLRSCDVAHDAAKLNALCSVYETCDLVR